MESTPESPRSNPGYDFVVQWPGAFHGIWGAFDMVADYAVGKFLKIPAEQTHLITAGMMFGRKAHLLASLIKHSTETQAKKSKLLGPLNWIRGQAKRDVIAHGYHSISATKVKFIERPPYGEFIPKPLVFTHVEFAVHVRTLGHHAQEFENALEATGADLDAFNNAMFNLSSKSTTSPGCPDE